MTENTTNLVYGAKVLSDIQAMLGCKMEEASRLIVKGSIRFSLDFSACSKKIETCGKCWIVHGLTRMLHAPGAGHPRGTASFGSAASRDREGPRRSNAIVFVQHGPFGLLHRP